MPNIGLILSKPQVTYWDSEFGSDGWRLGFEACLANSYRQHVDLTTNDGDLRNLDGTVSFEPISKQAYMGFEKGAMTYWKGSDDVIGPFPARYLVTLRLPDEDLARLMKTIADGLPLLSVNVSVDDMAYGWEPDGSGMKWDNATKPAIEVKGFGLFFGKHEEKEVVPDPPEPAVETDIKMLVALREIRQGFRYILYALIAVIAVVAMRRW